VTTPPRRRRLRGLIVRVVLEAIRAFDRTRLHIRMLRTPGLEIHPEASSNLAAARMVLAPGARLRIGPGVVTERRAGALHFDLGPSAHVDVGADTWLRTDVEPVYIAAFEGARIEIGPEGFLNGCHLSAKRAVLLGRRVYIGFGCRVFDADQHDLDMDRPEAAEPVSIGDHVWIAADSTVLRGVAIGAHSVIGTRSLVTRDIPAHTLAFGNPAEPRGVVGDRTGAR
jgi:acetyltransferase-like isoleucine patch superfamily enzyme